MVAKPAHTRVTIEGVVGTTAAPVEHWSFNINFPEAVSGAAATTAALEAKAGAVIQAWSDDLTAQMPLDVICTKVRVAHVGADGHVTRRADGSYVQGDWLGASPGTQAKQPMPLQTALCVSLGTTRAGATGKGRFFLPWPARSLDATDKLIPVAQVNTLVTAVQDFLQDLATGMGDDPVVVSSKGYTSDVTSLRIGRAPDTMRSRREDAPEGYVTAALHP